MIYETNYIMHFNPNHDKLGRFAKGTSAGIYSKSTAKKLNAIDKMAQKEASTRSDKKISKKLDKLANDLWYDTYENQTDLTNRLQNIVSKSEYTSFDEMSKDLKALRADTIKRRDTVANIFSNSLAKIGERDIGDGFTSQQLGSETIKSINSLMSMSLSNYDNDIKQIDDILDLLKTAPK